MKFFVDVLLALILILFFSIFILLIIAAVRLTSKGPIFYWSDRIGKHNKVFKMPKFRSMLLDTPVVATHLLDSPAFYVALV